MYNVKVGWMNRKNRKYIIFALQIDIGKWQKRWNFECFRDAEKNKTIIIIMCVCVCFQMLFFNLYRVVDGVDIYFSLKHFKICINIVVLSVQIVINCCIWTNIALNMWSTCRCQRRIEELFFFFFIYNRFVVRTVTSWTNIFRYYKYKWISFCGLTIKCKFRIHWIFGIE